MVGNLRKEERAVVSTLCLGRREIRGAVIGCVERSYTDKSQQRKSVVPLPVNREREMEDYLEFCV